MNRITAIEKHLAVDCEAVITVCGKEKFVVMDMQQYNFLRECKHEKQREVMRSSC